MLPSLAMKISTTTVRKVMIKEVLSSGARDQAGALTSGAEQASQGIIWHQSPFTMAYVTMSYVTYHNGTMSYVSYVICHHVTRVDFATHLGNWLCHKHCVVTRKMAHMSQPARLQPMPHKNLSAIPNITTQGIAIYWWWSNLSNQFHISIIVVGMDSVHTDDDDADVDAREIDNWFSTQQA